MSHSFTIRKATTDDVPAIASLHVTTFRETHGSFNAPTFETRTWQWQKIFADENQNWFCLVVENENGELAGFAKGQSYQHADQPNYSGELNKIYLLQQYQKSGLGKRLICKVATEFLQRSINNMLLFGDAGNASNKFYERMGAEKLFTKSGDFHGGYGWKDLQELAALCEDV